MPTSNIFEHFRRDHQPKGSLKSVKQVFFKIGFDDFGACLAIVDQKGKEVEVSYLSYSGAKRNLLRFVEEIREKNSFVIDWERPAEKLYLSDYEFLFEFLKDCDNLIGEDGRPIQFAEQPGHYKLILTRKIPEEGKLAPKHVLLSSKLSLVSGTKEYSDFKTIGESYAFSGSLIVSTPPLGKGFAALPYFNAEISESDLSVFLSLLFSNTEQVEVVYEDYQVQHSPEKVFARPCLIFEKIDVDDSLFLRVGQVLADFSVDVLEQFDLYRYAEINDMERNIYVKYIEQEPIEVVIDAVSKLLKKHRPKKRRKEEQAETILHGDLFIIPKETAANFIYNELPQLLTQFQVFGAEKLRTYKISAVAPSLSLSLSHGIDFFEGEVQLDFEGEQIDLFDVLAQYRQNHYVQLSDGTHALINEAYIRRLERLFKKKGKKARVSFFDLPLVEEIIDEKVAAENFQKPRAFFEGMNKLTSKKSRLPKLNATLRPYQKQGYKWLKYLQEFQLGACLADDMGLGKTLQAIALLASAYPKEKKPSLIVMPRTLLSNWKNELRRFAPQLRTYTFYGTNRKLAEARKADLIFITYALMRNEIEQLKEESFYYVILDESQNIKNVNAKTTKAAMLLQAKYRLALSGTPIENNLGELYSLFRFLNPSMFGSLAQFNKDYLAPIQKNNDKTAILHLRKKIYPFILRRLKKDVLSDLPDKIEQTLYVEMSEPQKKLYEQRRQFYQTAIKAAISQKGIQQTRFFVFQALNELRQIASIPEGISDGKILSPKRELLEEQLLDAIANGHKALIFVNYLAAIEHIGAQLVEAGIDFVSMTGATANRQILVDRFQTDPNCKVFLMTLKTGGIGLNLTAADIIFIFDPWWNLAAETQAIDRAHRIGQTKKVLAYKLITQGSIEEKMLHLQQLKKELFDNIISADSASMKSLSVEDINFILGA